MDDFDPMDKFIMGECGHYFCRDCALEYFKTSLNEFPIKVLLSLPPNNNPARCECVPFLPFLFFLHL
jgi:hypothetical protein